MSLIQDTPTALPSSLFYWILLNNLEFEEDTATLRNIYLQIPVIRSTSW